MDSVPTWLWPWRRATMLKWQGIEFQILKLKLHCCTTYRVVGAGVGGRHRYWLLYVFQGIGLNGRSMPFLGPSWEPWRHHCRISPWQHSSLLEHYLSWISWTWAQEYRALPWYHWGSSEVLSEQQHPLTIYRRPQSSWLDNMWSHRHGKPWWSNTWHAWCDQTWSTHLPDLYHVYPRSGPHLGHFENNTLSEFEPCPRNLYSWM